MEVGLSFREEKSENITAMAHKTILEKCKIIILVVVQQWRAVGPPQSVTAEGGA